MQFRTICLAVLSSATLLACTPIEIIRSPGPEVAQALSGKTVVGNHVDYGSFCEFHDANGLVVIRDTELYAGNWVMNGDTICYTYPQLGTNCQYVLLNGTRATFMDAFGGTISTGNIVDGNVCA